MDTDHCNNVARAKEPQQLHSPPFAEFTLEQPEGREGRLQTRRTRGEFISSWRQVQEGRRSAPECFVGSDRSVSRRKKIRSSGCSFVSFVLRQFAVLLGAPKVL
jgi:hypothetical protein